MVASNPPSTADTFRYHAPHQIPEHGMFQQLLAASRDPRETFDSLLVRFHAMKGLSHCYEFRYRLPGDTSAERVFKALQVKAQQAHRFVPVIEQSQFVAPCHLGFTRTIQIRAGGPAVTERILFGSDRHTVLFIEETVYQLGEGELPVGYASINKLIQDDSAWSLIGTYLYAEQNSVEAMRTMFAKTFDNMLGFAQTEQLDAVYAQLAAF